MQLDRRSVSCLVVAILVVTVIVDILDKHWFGVGMWVLFVGMSFVLVYMPKDQGE